MQSGSKRGSDKLREDQIVWNESGGILSRVKENETQTVYVWQTALYDDAGGVGSS